jgi:hypothetical protein
MFDAAGCTGIDILSEVVSCNVLPETGRVKGAGVYLVKLMKPRPTSVHYSTIVAGQSKTLGHPRDPLDLRSRHDTY